MHAIIADRRAVAALEFALLLPVMVMGIGQSADIFQQMYLRQSVAFVAMASAAAGAAVLNAAGGGGTQAGATSKAQAVAAANGVLFDAGATVSAPTITFNGGLISVRIVASEDAFFPIFTPTVSADITATD